MPTRAATFLDVYGDICRCESCSHLQDWDGLREFAERGPEQTIPVSHFGQVGTAKIWLICFNPAADRDDANVGLTVSLLQDVLQDRIQAGEIPNFSCRADPPARAVEEAVRHFSEYDFKSNGHEFFTPWRNALSALTVGKNLVTFENGGICVVDAIKCPTRRPIGGWHAPESKIVATNCGKDGNGFLVRQIAFHNPPILIFAGTQRLLRAAERGTPSPQLLRLAAHPYVTAVRHIRVPRTPRLSIELGGARGIKRVDSISLRMAIQRVITAWVSECTGIEGP